MKTISPIKISLSRSISSLILIATLMLGNAAFAEPQDTYKQLETFSNVLSIMEHNYVEEIDTEKIIEGAIKGMLNTLDPHSSFLKPEDFKELQVETKGSFTGIGIEITMRDNILTVVSPIEGTPAYSEGLKAGDKIIKIEADSTKDMTLMEAVNKLRGPKGSQVTISIHREGWTELKEITITRDIIPLASVKVKMLDPDFAYVRITNFQGKTTKDLKKDLNKLIDQYSVKGLVLDLRNNPGGLLEQAVKVTDLFLKDGVIVSTKGRLADQNDSYNAHAIGTNYSMPMVVLVNEGSASASEIVAGALQDHKRALILGAQTFGKGSVQTILQLNNGAGLRLTTARYYTPNGTSIQATGIVPDIVIPTQAVEVTATPNEQPKFIKEKDLKRHITNGNDDQEEIAADDKSEIPADEKEDAEDFPSEEELRMDNQLYTALIILKGLDVFDHSSRK